MAYQTECQGQVAQCIGRNSRAGPQGVLVFTGGSSKSTG